VDVQSAVSNIRSH